MKTLALAALLFASVSIARAEGEATDAAKTHLATLLKADFDEVANTYAPEVQLMAGHEFLKDKYGVAEAGSRETGASVSTNKLVAAMKKSMEGKPERPADKVAEMLTALTYETVETEPGDFGINPSDRDIPDAKLHFTIVEGDALIKVAPPEGSGDFLLLQLRKIEDNWRVVAEYLD